MGSAAIPLQVQAPQARSPLQTISGLMQIRGQMADIALRDAQMEQAKQQQQLIKVEQEQKNRDLADVNTYTALIKDPDVQASFNGTGDISPFQKAGIQPKYIDALIKSRQDKLAGAATLDRDTLANRASALGQIKETAVNLGAPDADGKPASIDTVNSRYQSARSGLAPVMKLAGIDPADLPASIHSLEELGDVIGKLHGSEAFYAAALGHKGERAKQELETSSARKLTAEAVGAELSNQLRSAVLSGGSNAAEKLIRDRFAENPQAAERAVAAFRQNVASGDIKAAEEEVNRVYENEIGAASKLKSETPAKVAEQAALLPGEVRKAGQSAMAEIPARVAGAVQTQSALAKASPDAFAGIVDAPARRQAMDEADKIDKEYTDKLNLTQQLVDTIDLAQKGNKAAPGVIPMAEVRGFVNRVNSQELKAVSTNAGSIIDRIQGRISGVAEGEPIPADILRDMKTLATLQQQAARRGYDSGINRLKQRGVDTSKLSNPDSAKAIVKSASMDQVRAYAKAHGISDADARKAAEADGYQVQ